MTWSVPSESIDAQIRALLRADASPEDAVAQVLKPYGETPLPHWAKEGMLRQAKNLYRKMNRRLEDRAFATNGDEKARLQLARTQFTLPSGRRHAWEDLTLRDLELKAAWLRASISSLSIDLERIERAIELLSNYPSGTRLSDVPDWQATIADPEWSDDPPPSEDRSQAAQPAIT